MSPQEGMRRSLITNSLVLVSDHKKALYEDRWQDILYTGKGSLGDQKLDFQQNRTLANHLPMKWINIFLKCFGKMSMFPLGQVELVGQPYQEEQLDVENNSRSFLDFFINIKGLHNTY